MSVKKLFVFHSELHLIDRQKDDDDDVLLISQLNFNQGKKTIIFCIQKC